MRNSMMSTPRKSGAKGGVPMNTKELVNTLLSFGEDGYQIIVGDGSFISIHIDRDKKQVILTGE